MIRNNYRYHYTSFLDRAANRKTLAAITNQVNSYLSFVSALHFLTVPLYCPILYYMMYLAVKTISEFFVFRKIGPPSLFKVLIFTITANMLSWLCMYLLRVYWPTDFYSELIDMRRQFFYEPYWQVLSFEFAQIALCLLVSPIIEMCLVLLCWRNHAHARVFWLLCLANLTSIAATRLLMVIAGAYRL